MDYSSSHSANIYFSTPAALGSAKIQLLTSGSFQPSKKDGILKELSTR